MLCKHTFPNILSKWKTTWKMISVERWNVFFICSTCGCCQWFCGPMLAVYNVHSSTSCIWTLHRICPVDLLTLFTSSYQITHNPGKKKKKQLLNGLYCLVATFIIFNKIIHKLLWSQCSTERNLLLFSFSSFFCYYLSININYCLPSSGHFCPIHFFFFLMLLQTLIFHNFGPNSLWYLFLLSSFLLFALPLFWSLAFHICRYYIKMLLREAAELPGP